MMAFLLLTIINGCQKDEPIQLDDQPQNVVKNPMFLRLETIAFSVENDILLFDTEEDFQKCVDFLANLKEEYYDDFEKEIGFISIRRSLNERNLQCPIEDNIFSTLINPKMQIAVEKYLFTLNLSSKNLIAQFIGDNCDLKSIIVDNKGQLFSFNQEVFAILKNESHLKSIQTDFCGQEDVVHENPDGIVTKVDYNTYGIYFSLVSKIQNIFNVPTNFTSETINSPLDAHPDGITSRCFYKRVGKQDEIIYNESTYGTIQTITSYSNLTRRLYGFRLDVKFSWDIIINGVPYVYYDTAMIECHHY